MIKERKSRKKHCFTVDNLYEAMNRKYLNYRWIKECKLPDKTFAVRIFNDCFYEILLDIIHNNVTFVLPLTFGQYGEIHMQQHEGEEFKRLYKLGKYNNIDFILSGFTGNQLYYNYTTKKKEPRKKPIYVSKNLKDWIKKYTEEGKAYY